MLCIFGALWLPLSLGGQICHPVSSLLHFWKDSMFPSINASRIERQEDAGPYLSVRVVNMRDIEIAYGLEAVILVRRAVWTRLAAVGGPEVPIWHGGNVLSVSLRYAAQAREFSVDGISKFELSNRTALSMPIEIGFNSWVCPLIATELTPAGRLGFFGPLRRAVGDGQTHGEPVWENRFREDMVEVSRLLQDLRSRRLRLAFQPVVLVQDLSSVLYDELLLRPPGGEPGQITTALERLGAAWLLDRSVVWTAIEVLESHPARHLACNVSATSFHPGPWWYEVEDFLQSRPSTAARLIIEVTETGILQDMEQALGLISRLQKIGVRVAFDDVGTGNLTLAFLLEASPGVIKIDRSMLQQAARSKEGRHRFRSLIQLCASCSPCVVVEGIENEADLSLVKAGVEVSAIQGYAIATPDGAPPWLNASSQVVSMR